MAGKEKLKIYHYDRDGSFVRVYESVSEFARDYGVQQNMFKNSGYERDVVKLYDDTFAAKYRIGREGIRKYKARLNSEFVGINKALAKGKANASGDNFRILVYDLDGDKIATFENAFVAKKFGIEHHEIRQNKKGIYNTDYNSKGLKIVLEEK